MTRTDAHALAYVDYVASCQDGLVTSAQLVEIGLARSTVSDRARQGGPWRRVLPSVYAVSGQALSEAQRIRAAVLYVGSPCLVTGGAALRRRGIRAAASIAPSEVHVLVPHERRRASTHFVHVQRARHWPRVESADEVPAAPVARAALDATRTLHSRNDVAALLTEVVRDGHATLADLERELGILQRRRSALAREVIRSIRAGVVSTPEHDLRRRWLASDLPVAFWNPDLYVGGEFLARPDVYLPDHGVVVEVDSAEFHAGPEAWERTMRRHARLSSRGLLVLHVTPRRVRTDWDALCEDVLSAVRAQDGRVLPEVRVAERRP